MEKRLNFALRNYETSEKNMLKLFSTCTALQVMITENESIMKCETKKLNAAILKATKSFGGARAQGTTSGLSGLLVVSSHPAFAAVLKGMLAGLIHFATTNNLHHDPSVIVDHEFANFFQLASSPNPDIAAVSSAFASHNKVDCTNAQCREVASQLADIDKALKIVSATNTEPLLIQARNYMTAAITHRYTFILGEIAARSLIRASTTKSQQYQALRIVFSMALTWQSNFDSVSVQVSIADLAELSPLGQLARKIGGHVNFAGQFGLSYSGLNAAMYFLQQSESSYDQSRLPGENLVSMQIHKYVFGSQTKHLYADLIWCNGRMERAAKYQNSLTGYLQSGAAIQAAQIGSTTPGASVLATAHYTRQFNVASKAVVEHCMIEQKKAEISKNKAETIAQFSRKNSRAILDLSTEFAAEMALYIDPTHSSKAHSAAVEFLTKNSEGALVLLNVFFNSKGTLSGKDTRSHPLAVKVVDAALGIVKTGRIPYTLPVRKQLATHFTTKPLTIASTTEKPQVTVSLRDQSAELVASVNKSNEDLKTLVSKQTGQIRKAGEQFNQNEATYRLFMQLFGALMICVSSVQYYGWFVSHIYDMEKPSALGGPKQIEDKQSFIRAARDFLQGVQASKPSDAVPWWKKVYKSELPTNDGRIYAPLK